MLGVLVVIDDGDGSQFVGNGTMIGVADEGLFVDGNDTIRRRGGAGVLEGGMGNDSTDGGDVNDGQGAGLPGDATHDTRVGDDCDDASEGSASPDVLGCGAWTISSPGTTTATTVSTAT
jgi:hypothetical protein